MRMIIGRSYFIFLLYLLVSLLAFSSMLSVDVIYIWICVGMAGGTGRGSVPISIIMHMVINLHIINWDILCVTDIKFDIHGFKHCSVLPSVGTLKVSL